MKGLPSSSINEANYLSVGLIAKELGRNRVSVHRFIQKRPRIKPAFILNGCRYFNRAVLGKIARGMRRRNGCNGHATP